MSDGEPRKPWDTWIWEESTRIMERADDGSRSMVSKPIYRTGRFYEGPDEALPPDGAVRLQTVWDFWKRSQRSCGTCAGWSSAKGVCGWSRDDLNRIRQEAGNHDAFWHPGHAFECDFWKEKI